MTLTRDAFFFCLVIVDFILIVTLDSEFPHDWFSYFTLLSIPRFHPLSLSRSTFNNKKSCLFSVFLYRLA